MLAMVDMRISNLFSVQEAFRRVGNPVTMVSEASDLKGASAIILPGVGTFEDGMSSLRKQGLVEAIHHHVLSEKTPILGICLGMQLLGDESEEFGLHTGLGLLGGRITKLEPPSPDLRVPNMGWCDVEPAKPDGVLFSRRSSSAPTYYFAHSYHFQCEDGSAVAGTIDYGSPVTAAVERDNIFGIQFHPEKSQSAGLDLLASFCAHVGEDTLHSSAQ